MSSKYFVSCRQVVEHKKCPNIRAFMIYLHTDYECHSRKAKVIYFESARPINLRSSVFTLTLSPVEICSGT